MQPGTVTGPWTMAFWAGWLLVAGGFAAVWFSSRTTGLSTWWLGPESSPSVHYNLVPFITQAAAGLRDKLTVFGNDSPTRDGSCIRDYIHIADLASAHILALGALESKDKMIYNIGSGSGFSVREVIETARQVTGYAIPVVEAPRRPSDSARLVA